LASIYKNVATVVKIIVSIFLIGYLINKLDFDLISNVIKQSNPFLLFISLLIISSTIILSSYKWNIILKNMGENTSYPLLVSLYFKGFFINNFFPSNIGGDGYKFIKLSSKINSTEKSFASIFYDRFSGIIILFVLSLLSSILFSFYFGSVIKTFLETNANYIVVASIVFASLAISIIVAFNKKIKFVIQKIKDGARIINLQVIALSLILYIVIIFNNYLISVAYNLEIDYIYYLIFMPIILLLLFLPISFNGIGIRELSFVYFFGLIGVGREEAFLLGITPYLLLLLNSFIGGILLLVGKRKN